MSGGAQIPANLQLYDSYAIDPRWQRKFTIIWTSFLAFGILVSLPYLARSIKRRWTFISLFGISEGWTGKPYSPVQERPARTTNGRWNGIVRTLASTTFWTITGCELNLGRTLLIFGYIITVVLCIVLKSELTFNSNRAGFLAVAQFPVVFLFATKNSILSLLLGPGHGYEKLNFIHRWSGRGLFLAAVIHGSMMINQHLRYSLPILGQQKETSGIASFSLLCILVLTSLRSVRRLVYQGFFVVHVLGYSAFFITVCTHTPYASPWIFPPLALYGLDILMRMFRYRIKDATLVPVDDQMTVINIHDCDGGWQAGQHVRLRVFFSGRIFESHPLTILNAPLSISALSKGTLTLGARVVGDWTRSLNEHARKERQRLLSCSEKETKPEAFAGVPIQVMIDGPYGGCSIDLGDFEKVLLISGGSGVTFALGVLDDIIGRCIKLGRQNGERTKRIEFTWCIRSYACIEWFSPMLMDLANTVAGTSLDLHFSVFVTCICNPEAVPPIPNLVVTVGRPSVREILNVFVAPEERNGLEKALSGGVGVCASGPEGLIRQVSNAVARASLSRGVEVGGFGLHTEAFSI